MIFRKIAFFVGFTFFLTGSERGGAQETTPAADEILSLVQAFYDRADTLEAEFAQVRYTRLYDRYDRAKGKVVFKKPGKMRWDYQQPNGQVFVTAQGKLLIYQPPEEGEKHGQLIERSLDQDQLPSAFSFLTGTGDLQNDFDVRRLESPETKFKDGFVLQLIPRKPSPNYEQLVFFVRVVESGGKKGAVVQRVLIIDAAGNRNRFDFDEIKFNRAVPDTRFTYKPPKGTYRVKR